MLHILSGLQFGNKLFPNYNSPKKIMNRYNRNQQYPCMIKNNKE